jgi:hypothetical protein
MELELSLPKHLSFSLLIGLAFLLAVFLLGTAGKPITPDGSRLLTWSDWKVFNNRRAYQRELLQIQTQVVALTSLLEEEPDAVRAQLLSEAILNLDGLAVLDYQRELLRQAAAAVRDWSVGAVEKQAALDQLDQVRLSLTMVGVQDGQ